MIAIIVVLAVVAVIGALIVLWIRATSRRSLQQHAAIDRMTWQTLSQIDQVSERVTQALLAEVMRRRQGS